MAATTTARKQRSRSEASMTSAEGSTASAEGSTASDTAGVIKAYVWSPDGNVAEVDSLDHIQRAFADPDTRLWIDLEDASQGTLESIAGCLELHHLIVEDIVERNQRAKVEYTDETMHLVLFALQYDGELMTAELDIVLGERFLLTSHPPAWRPTETPNIRRNGVGHFLDHGVDHMLWAVVDAAIDGYFPVFDRLGDEIDDLQDDVLRRPSSRIVERVFQVRRDLLTIRHAVSPEREVFNQLTNRENPLIHPDRIIYFRDVYDHLIRLTDELDSFREQVGTTLDAYLSTVNNNLSEVMKRLTAVTAVLAGAGAVAGIFGMSEAGLALSLTDPRFWVVTIAILVGAVAGFAYFRRIGWI
ncbi:MAG: magnesium transporter CorA family protein [Chloroflexi bacterium]|nr:magnesium transporter CorA family protein [Chloroflexota bacterium]